MLPNRLFEEVGQQCLLGSLVARTFWGLNHTQKKRVPRNVREQKPFIVDLSSIGTAIELLQPSPTEFHPKLGPRFHWEEPPPPQKKRTALYYVGSGLRRGINQDPTLATTCHGPASRGGARQSEFLRAYETLLKPSPEDPKPFNPIPLKPTPKNF